jgi:asparagine synthase (glutamine-hydrolysing)
LTPPGADADGPARVDIRVERKGYGRYWTMVAGQLRHGESLPELLAQLPASPQLDVGRLHAMAAGRGGIWLTPYAGIQRLTFGHRLRWRPGEAPQITRWFTPEDEPVAAPGSGVDQLRAAIRDAVVEEVEGADGCSVAMSGGLDSPTVAVVAAEVLGARSRGVHRSPVLALCASPQPGTPPTGTAKVADDWSAASAVGDRVAGLDVRRLVNQGMVGPLDFADDFHVRWAMPVSAPANLWWLRESESVSAREARRVILTGTSGNATFSVGPPGAPGRLLRDGSREASRAHFGVRGGVGPPGWPARVGRSAVWDDLRGDGWSGKTRGALLAAMRRRRAGGSPPSPLRGGIATEMPEHVLAMTPYVRWCLAEPLSAAVGPWSGADVRWADPLGSPQVIRAAFALPADDWTAGGLDRSVARRLTRGMLPDQVRLRRSRGDQSADLPDLIRRDAHRYTAALASFRESPTTAEILDTDVMWASRQLLQGSRADAVAWRMAYLRPFTVALFTTWWDSWQ